MASDLIRIECASHLANVELIVSRLSGGTRGTLYQVTVGAEWVHLTERQARALARVLAAELLGDGGRPCPPSS